MNGILTPVSPGAYIAILCVIGGAGNVSSANTDPLAIPVRARSEDPSSPSFAEQDVVNYVSTHPVPRAISNDTSTVAHISFMTSGAASKMLRDEPIGLPENALVSVVEVHGSFTLHNLLTTGTATQVFEVFDAHTGELLMVAFLQ